jgi:hypothetical protein
MNYGPPYPVVNGRAHSKPCNCFYRAAFAIALAYCICFGRSNAYTLSPPARLGMRPTYPLPSQHAPLSRRLSGAHSAAPGDLRYFDHLRAAPVPCIPLREPFQLGCDQKKAAGLFHFRGARISRSLSLLGGACATPEAGLVGQACAVTRAREYSCAVWPRTARFPICRPARRSGGP